VLFIKKGIFRNEPRSRPIVVVRVVDPVGVELDLAVVEVEDRSVRKRAIGIRIIVFIHLCHQNLNMILTGNKIYSYL